MSSAPSSPSSKRYWPFVAALFAVAFSIHFLRREPAPAPSAAAARGDDHSPTAPTEVATSRAEGANPSRGAPSPAAATDELARNVVGALPQGEREAQRLKVMEVEALVRSGRVGSARAQAAAYYERWPGGPDTAALEALTGAHPRVDRAAPDAR